MRMPVASKVFFLLLLVSLGSLTNSYARNDQKGGHGSGAAHVGGGHGSGEKEPLVGRIDQATQKAAFRFGNNKTTVIETGAYNLTQEEASCFVRFGAGPPQTWLMVRLPAPTMPNAPTRLSEQPKPSEGSG